MRIAARSVAVLMFAFCWDVPAAFAQSEPPAPESKPAVDEAEPATATVDEGGVRTYVLADFARFAPRTAIDMLNRIPGFAIKQEDFERGLGQATGNVVINGQRISGKSNDVVTELSRIPIESVLRIEIVDGATLDIAGLSGQVANVIVQQGGISGQYAYRPEFRAFNTDPLLSRFELSVSGTKGPVEYTVGLDNRANRSGASGPTSIYDPAGSLMESRDEQWRGNFDQPRISGRLVLDGPGSSVGNLNLSYTRIYYDYLETGIRTGPGQPDREREVTVDEGGYNYEMGGDYEFVLGPGPSRADRFESIGLHPERKQCDRSFRRWQS